MKKLEGVVLSSKGEFGHRIEKLQDIYRRKTGMDLYPTLNVLLDEALHLPKDSIRLEKEEYDGEVSESLVPCMLYETLGFLIQTDKNKDEEPGHSRKLVEIVCKVRLREKYNLKDGDGVQITLI